MRYVTFLFWGLIIFLGVVFATLNSSSVEIHYFLGSFKIYLPLLLVLQLLMGAVLGVLAMLPWLVRSQHGNRKLKNRVKQIELEVRNLRTMPIKDAH